MSASTETPPADLDTRDVAALTEYMTVLADVGRARDAEGLYSVTTQSGREYLVDVHEGACECDDSFYRDPDGGCKHVRRVEFATGRRPIPAWADRSRIDPDLGRHVDDVHEDDLDRGEGIETDGGESDGDLPELHVGDHVQDREDPDATMLVVCLDTYRADAYEFGGGTTVADVNEAYPPTDDVVEVTFPSRTDMDVDTKRYAFPRSRLELVTPIHDRDDEDETDGEEVPDRGEGVETDGGVEVDDTASQPKSDAPADDEDVAIADYIDAHPLEVRKLPRSFLAEASGPVTRLTERADGVVEREPVDVEISRRLETPAEFAAFYEHRSKREWKRAALNELLAETECETVTYDIDADQLEAWDVQIDGRADAYRGLVEVLAEYSFPDESAHSVLGRELKGYGESLEYGSSDVDKVTTDLAQDCVRSDLFGPGARLAQLVERHAARDDLESYVEALLEDLEVRDGETDR